MKINLDFLFKNRVNRNHKSENLIRNRFKLETIRIDFIRQKDAMKKIRTNAVRPDTALYFIFLFPESQISRVKKA